MSALTSPPLCEQEVLACIYGVHCIIVPVILYMMYLKYERSHNFGGHCSNVSAVVYGMEVR